VPDFEIRYFHFDGSLALIHVTAHETRAQAESHAELNRHPHARFEVIEMSSLRSVRSPT